jgi:hypothetical protein
MLSKLEEGIRIDAELYQKKFIAFFNRLQEFNLTSFENEAVTIKKGIFDIKADCYSDKGVPFVRISNLKNMVIEDSDIVYIPTHENEKNLDTFLQRGDIILSKTANPAASLVSLDFCNVSQDTIAIKLKSNSKILSHFVVAYLNTIYGLELMKRWFTGNIQMHLNLDDCKRNLLIPLLGMELQKLIKQLFEKSLTTETLSTHLYTQAEILLLDTLGLADFSPSMEKVNIKLFKDSFAATGRLDAEYYQPKFDQLEAKLAETHLLHLLSEFLTINQRGTQPDYAEEGLPVINSKHVREGEVILTDNRFARIPDKEKPLFINKGDVLINGTGVGTIGRAAPYLHDQQAIPDNHVTVLRTDKLNPIYLSVYLNSIAGKYQVDKYFKGSSGQIELYPTDIDRFYVPFINENSQTRIAALVQQSFTLKAESEQLLDVAKRAVEIAIETDEQTAVEYVNEQIGDY